MGRIIKSDRTDLKVYEYIKDYPLAGKKAGERIKLGRLPHHLKKYVKEVGADAPVERPDETWNKVDIIGWLNDNGVTATEGTKAQLLEMVAEI
jgi:hypothetical protein